MRLDDKRSFVFIDGNKHGLIKWLPADCLLADEFTVLARISPDYEKIDKLLDIRPVIQQVVLGKNGKHMGLCFVGYVDGDGVKRHKISYEWWQNPNWANDPDPSKDHALDTKIDFMPGEKPETIDIVLEKANGKFSMEALGQVHEQTYNGIIDYTTCFTWLGCGNKTFVSEEDNKRHGAIYYGDISLLHIQDGKLLTKDKNLFFDNFENFNVYFKADKKKVIYFSSDFEDTTMYKIMDKSANGNHPLLFDREWLDIGPKA